MKKFKGLVYGIEAVIFASEEDFREHERDKERIISWIKACLRDTFAGKFDEYIRLFAQKKNLPPLAIIVAHGLVCFRQWFYCDDGEGDSLQDWINRRDGKYACLVILSCNPEALTPKSKKSLLLIADRNVRAIRGEEGAIFTLISPTQGEIDSYTIDYELTLLKQS